MRSPDLDTRVGGAAAASLRAASTPHAETWLACLVLVVATACVTPAEKANERAGDLGFERQRATGTHFEHVLYWKPGSEWSDGALHVYIEGDGSPRRAMRYRPPDPTPSNVVMLELMALDPGPSLYLGRPAQHGAPAEPWDWTLGRYSKNVVDSMARALENWNRANGQREFVLIGHSGGGTLAMLLAERVKNALGVVTLAGNLDLEAWARHHDYQPLDGSQDPARRPPLDREIFQLHLLAGRDQRVPIALVESSIARQPDPKTRLFPDFDHSCCWATIWLDVVVELQGHAASR